MSHQKLNKLNWILVIAYLLYTIIKTLTNVIPPSLSMVLNIGILMSIAIFHGMARYSFRQFLNFFLIVFVISSIYENVSVLTGFPFGNYHHADSLGPKLFLIPIIIAPTYFVVGYLSWVIALTLTGTFEKTLRGDQIWSVPLVASFVMTMWDLQIDSISSTIKQAWFWHDGGSFFGVPFENYTGWLLCTFTFFQVFSIYISRRSNSTNKNKEELINSSYWYQALITYISLSLPVVALPMIGKDFVVTDLSGTMWGTMDMYQSMTIITIFTMWFVGVLSFINVRKHRTN